MNEAFEKWLKTWPKKGQAPRPTVQEGFLAGLAAAEQVCRDQMDLDAPPSAILDAIKAMREQT